MNTEGEWGTTEYTVIVLYENVYTLTGTVRSVDLDYVEAEVLELKRCELTAYYTVNSPVPNRSWDRHRKKFIREDNSKILRMLGKERSKS